MTRLLVAAVTIWIALAHFPARAEQALVQTRQAATLHAVHAIDSRRAIAVGDHGTILVTADGGESWQSVLSGVPDHLYSLSFVDGRNGWAVGGYGLPITGASQGVVIRTADSGATWSSHRDLPIPAFQHVRFFSANQGTALAREAFGGAAWWTDDGGRTWTPLDGAPAGIAAAFASPLDGLVLDSSGRLFPIANRRLEPPTDLGCGMRTVRAVSIGPHGRGCIVGDGGLVLLTDDDGRSWHTPTFGALATAVRSCDWRAVTCTGQQICLVGSPGSLVLLSTDGGQSWSPSPTGQLLPLNGVAFADTRHGWAVGALGTILATVDGGQTWTIQRQAARRVALLGIFGRPGSMPLPLFASASGDLGYLSAAVLVARADAEPGQLPASYEAARAGEALAAVGASATEAAWSFPIRADGIGLPREDLLAGWSLSVEGDGLARLQDELVRKIRMWRPDVVCAPAGGLGADALENLVYDCVTRAVELAAHDDGSTHPSKKLWLEPWTVERVISTAPAGRRPAISLSTAQFSQPLGRTLAGACRAAAGLTGHVEQHVPAAIGFDISLDRGAASGSRSVMSGIRHLAGINSLSDAAAEGSRDADAGRSHLALQNTQGILAHITRRRSDPARFLAQISDLTAGLPGTAAADVLFQLGDRYRQQGELDLADEAFGLLVDRYPDHELVPDVLFWQVHYRSSTEVALRHDRRQVRGGARDAIPAVSSTTESSPDVTRALRKIELTSANRSVDDRAIALSQSQAIAERLHTICPVTHRSTSLRLALAAGLPREENARRTGPPTREMVSGDSHWYLCEQGEAWLAQRASIRGPKPAYFARRTADRPRLDGRLDDEGWSEASVIDLRCRVADDSGWAAVALVMHDENCLYFGAECRRPAPVDPPPRQARRTRDADLAAFDRVEFYIDVDRDWTTAYRFVVDERGNIQDACWNDHTWDPTWYVAVSDSSTSWTVEAAIPWEDINQKAPAASDAWVFGCQRVVPSFGIQSWTAPAALQLPLESFGYLIFQ